MKLLLLFLYFGVLIGIGLYCRTRYGCERFCIGRPFRRSMADRIRLWHILFFRSRICGIRRTIWLEIWTGRHLGRNRQRHNRITACLGGSGPPDAHYDTTFGLCYHASVFWGTFWQQTSQGGSIRDHFCLSDPVYRFSL